MRQPKGIAVVLGVILGLIVIGAIVGGIVLMRESHTTPTPAANTNATLQLGCSVDADCSTYCGADPCFQPICGVSSIGESGSCTCRSICGPIGNTGNTNTSGNVNISTNTNATVNTNTSTNSNTNTAVNTAGWKTYTDTKYGYSFNYPASWRETVYVVDANSPLSGDGVKFEDPSGKAGSFAWMQKGYVPFQDGQWDSTSTSVTLGGRAATQLIYTPKVGQQWASGEPLPRAKVSITNNPTIWGSDASIGLTLGTSESWTTVNTILSTFTFIE